MRPNSSSWVASPCVGALVVLAAGCQAIAGLSDYEVTASSGGSSAGANGGSGGQGTGGGSSCGAGLQDNDANGTCSPACVGSSCSSHGTCDDSSGTVACTCDLEYTGDDCTSCATDYQDNDANGTCLPACDTNTCSSHGTCYDSSGTVACTCDLEYAGADCSSCATDYQDNDANGTCLPACDTNTCSSHGTCDDSSGTTVCTCDIEYTGDDCTYCAADYQDKDINDTCLPACIAGSCNGNGSCDDLSGQIVCSCTLPFSGTDCEICTLPALLDDQFGNDDIATGGGGDINGGFGTHVDNNGSVTESSGEAIFVTATDGGAEPHSGIFSNAPVDPLANDLTLRWEVTEADYPKWNGISLTLQQNPAFFEVGGGNYLSLAVEGDGVAPNDVVRIIGDTSSEFAYATEPYVVPDLADGFVAYLAVSVADGWSYRVEGLAVNAITGSGSWTSGYEPSDLFDNAMHMGAFIQGDNSDPIGRTLKLTRMSIYQGICGNGFYPTP